MGKEIDIYCKWPMHLDKNGVDMESRGCPVCFWWTLCWLLADVGVKVQPPMGRTNYLED